MVSIIDNSEMIGQCGHKGLHPRQVFFSQNLPAQAGNLQDQITHLTFAGDHYDTPAQAGPLKGAKLHRQAWRHCVHNVCRRRYRPALPQTDHRKQIFRRIERVAMELE